MSLSREAFELYRCDRNLVLGMNMANLSRILRCANNNDILTLKAEDSADNITFIIESLSGEKVSEYEMKLIDIDSENLGIPDQDYDAIVKLPSNELQRICRDLSQLSDSILISCTKDGIKFSTSADNTSGNITLRQTSSVDDSEESKVEVQLNDPITLTFALRYLNLFAKATPLSKTVSLSLSKDSPLVCEYKMEGGHLRYYLAPKFEEEEGGTEQADD